MATTSLVLINVLCFLSAKLGNIAVKYLQSAVLDFYDADELNAAKRLLLHVTWIAYKKKTFICLIFQTGVMVRIVPFALLTTYL